MRIFQIFNPDTSLPISTILAYLYDFWLKFRPQYDSTISARKVAEDDPRQLVLRL
jgi:hypothetical protein